MDNKLIRIIIFHYELKSMTISYIEQRNSKINLRIFHKK